MTVRDGGERLIQIVNDEHASERPVLFCSGQFGERSGYQSKAPDWLVFFYTKAFPLCFLCPKISEFHNKLTCFFWQITGVNVTYFIHGQDLGLVALMDTNGDLYYYEFDAQG